MQRSIYNALSSSAVSESANVAVDPVHGLPSSWGTKIRTGGLAVILMRAGLKIDKLAFKRAGRVVLRLAALPMLFEACIDTGLYYWYALPACCCNNMLVCLDTI